MKSKNPILVQKRKPLFPSYDTERTLRRHWKACGVTFREIRQGGMKAFFASNSGPDLPVGKIYIEGAKLFGITPRQYYAVVADRKIQSGSAANDQRQIYTLLHLLEKAESIDQSLPNAKSEAAPLIIEAEQAVGMIKNPETRDNYSVIVDSLRAMLAHLL